MPIEREYGVDENAFLVSKTDTKGRITYCNEPFLNIVGVKQGDLLGKPHNIIRHTDMPRVIFKLLWARIQNKQEMFAFIKNKTLNGGYYWVFGNITASLDQQDNVVGYYSVRRKPNAKAIEIIKPLYAKLLELERDGGIEASKKYLFNFLEEKSTSYDEFINNLQRL